MSCYIWEVRNNSHGIVVTLATSVDEARFILQDSVNDLDVLEAIKSEPKLLKQNEIDLFTIRNTGKFF